MMGFKFILVVVLLVAGAVGYYLWDQVPEAPKAATFTGYTEGLKGSEDKALAVASGANTEDVQGAVEKYRADKGALPASLQDLVPNYLDHVPGGLQYDAAAGKVSAAP
jgi:hypothetical protein